MSSNKDDQETASFASNPFIAFKNYADAQISSLLHDIVGLPSGAGSSSYIGMRREETLPTWSYFDDVAYWERRALESRNVLEQIRESGQVPDSFRWMTPFQRGLSLPDAEWVRDYLIDDAYSPLREREIQAKRGVSFPAAFEDLIRETYGLGYRRCSYAPDYEHTGLWLNKMQTICEEGRAAKLAERKRIESGQESGPSPSRMQCCGDEENDDELVARRHPLSALMSLMDDEEMSELSMFEDFLDRSNGKVSFKDNEWTEREATTTEKSGSTLPTTVGKLAEDSTILSTLTTTERSTDVNGRTVTKTVLKKRFADGREESKESFETTEPSRHQNSSGAISSRGGLADNVNHLRNTTDPANTPRKQETQEKEKQNGWFWSN